MESNNTDNDTDNKNFERNAFGNSEGNVQLDANDSKNKNKRSVWWKKKYGFVGLLLILSLILFFGLTYWMQTSNNAKVQNEIYLKYVSGDFKSSADLAKSNLQKNPKDKFLLKALLNANSSLGNANGKEKFLFNESQKYIDQAKQAGKDDPEMQIALGYVYETAGDYEQALSYYLEAISLDPEMAIAYFHKGHVLEFLDKQDEAFIAYDKAYQLDPLNGLVLIAKGNQYLQNKDTNKALEHFLKAGSNEKTAYNVRADAYLAASLLESQTSQYELAIDHAKEAMKLNPQSSLAYGLFGFNQCLLGNFADGLPALNESIKLNPRISTNFMFLGVVLRHLEYYDEAINFQLDGLSRVDSDNTLVGTQTVLRTKAKMYYELAQTYSMVPDEEKTVENLKAALALADYRIMLKNDLARGNYFVKLRNSKNLNALVN